MNTYLRHMRYLSAMQKALTVFRVLATLRLLLTIAHAGEYYLRQHRTTPVCGVALKRKGS